MNGAYGNPPPCQFFFYWNCSKGTSCLIWAKVNKKCFFCCYCLKAMKWQISEATAKAFNPKYQLPSRDIPFFLSAPPQMTGIWTLKVLSTPFIHIYICCSKFFISGYFLFLLFSGRLMYANEDDRQWSKVKTLLFQRCALRKFHVTDGQKGAWSNLRDQITSNRRLQRESSNCVLCIPYILTGSPNRCWLHTCNACIITTWKLGLQVPLVPHKNFSSWNQEWNSSPICKASSE